MALTRSHRFLQHLPLVAPLVAAGALALPASAGAADPVAGELAYLDASNRLATIWPDGSHREQLTSSAINQPTEPAWSADALRIAYGREGNEVMRFVFAPNRANYYAPIPDAAVSVAWDPVDGERVLMATGPDGLQRYAPGASGSPTKVLPGNFTGVQSAVDGTVVLTGADGAASLWDQQNTTTTPLVEDVRTGDRVALSRDGGTIAWVDEGPLANQSALVVGVPEPGNTQLQTVLDTDLDLVPSFPALSPDGQTIAFIGTDSQGAKAIYTVDAEPGAEPEMVPNTTSSSAPSNGLSWQGAVPPDGTAATISGTAEVGSPLTATATVATPGTPTVYTTYQWQSCEDAAGTDCSPIPYATGTMYFVMPTYEGKYLRVVATAANAGGEDDGVSATTAAVALPDTAPPATPDVSGPAPWVNGTVAEITFTGAEPGGRFECSTDSGQTWEVCSSPYSVQTPTEGDYDVSVRQVDASENLGDPAQASWSVDHTAPEPPIVISAPPARTTATAATIEVAPLGGVHGPMPPTEVLECAVDGDAWAPCPTTIDLVQLSLGAHEVRLRHTDAAGNSSEVVPVTWTIDPVQGPDPDPTPTPTPDPTPEPPAPPVTTPPTPVTTPPTPPTTTAPPTATTSTVAGVTLAPSAGGSATVKPDNSVKLALTCPEGEVCKASGNLTLSSGTSTRKLARAAAAARILAQFKDVTVRGGKVRTLKLRVPRSFVREAQKQGRRSVTATLRITTTLGSGSSSTHTQRVRLLIPRAAAKKQTVRPKFTG